MKVANFFESENFRHIMNEKGYSYPSTTLQIGRIQRMNSSESIPFEFDDNDYRVLKNHLGIEKINLPTAKKMAENILIANDLYHWKLKESMISLMGKENYNYHPSSFVHKSELDD